MKRWHTSLSVMLVILLMVGLFNSMNGSSSKVEASGTLVIKVLEITDNGQSDLSSLSFNDFKLELSTYSMKQFVGSRDYLDGKYDAVYIGKGIYDPDPAYMMLDTSSKQNDITPLKVNELKKYFVNKGLPFIVYQDSNSGYMKQKTTGELYKFITSITGKSNVLFVGPADLGNGASFASKTSLGTKGNLRPKLKITSKPLEYVGTTKIYTRGEKIAFDYTVENAVDLSHMTVNLYLGTDGAVPFTEKQLVKSAQVTAASATLSYTLPRGYSGPIYWRLELIDNNTTLNDVKAGNFRFKDEMKRINVLQFRGNNSGDDAGLDKDYNFDSSYLYLDGDYEIKFTARSINDFAGPTWYNNLQDYDMLIFGFAHEYKEFAFIEVQAARDALQKYIDSGKSVMFTHDTFNPYSREGNRSAYWNNFRGIAGMITPVNNTGNIDNSFTTDTKKVNTGLLTDFPFALPSDISVGSTHGQYYTLDLNDPEVIPWYNLSGGRTASDSWNHYYTYSKGNVTFTNSGHTGQTKTGYTVGERQLFLNTMYRAFTMANHGPVITVFSPVEYNPTLNNFIPTYEAIPVHYLVEDLDIGDTALKTTVNFIYQDGNVERRVTKIDNRPIISGTTINESFDNPLPNGGDLTVEIIAKDSRGAESKKQIKVKVAKVNASLELSRTFLNSNNVKPVDNKVDTGSTVTMNYTITPKPITGVGTSMDVTSVGFNEQLPANMEVVSLPPGFDKKGSLANGYQISGTLSNVHYTKKGTDTLFTADPVSFSIKVIPTKNGFYPLNSGSLTFSDINQSTKTKLSFPSVTLEAVTKLTSLNLSDQTLLVGDSVKLLPQYTPSDLTNVPFKWEIDQPGIAGLTSDGVVTGKALGTAVVKLTALDGSGLVATAKIKVVDPGLYIEGPGEVLVGDEITLNSKLLTADYEYITSYTWTIDSGSEFISFKAPANQASIIVRGAQAGGSVVRLEVKTNQGHTYSKTANVTVKSKLTGLNLTGTTLYVNQSKQLTAQFVPANVTNVPITWASSDPNVAIVTQDGKITGITKGTTVITITSQENKSISASATVSVIAPELTFNTTGVALGKKFTLTPNSITLAEGDSIKSYSWSDVTIADDASAGEIELRGGDTTDTVTYRALKHGNVDIKLTITTSLGYTESFVNTVSIAPVKLQLPSTMTLDTGITKEFNNLLASDPTDGKGNIYDFLRWESSDPDVLTVDSNGVVRTMKPGKASVKVFSIHDKSNVFTGTEITVKKHYDGQGKY
ncbi:DUF5057 domain-containing protein [Paenibacillus sp. SN-8-1]|uniref:DUF5057 domain-containing protein n=1 Tax=Paenibacillus sp. SN-8-1 TaxID=3435409 RepID=UPI003D9A8383